MVIKKSRSADLEKAKFIFILIGLIFGLFVAKIIIEYESPKNDIQIKNSRFNNEIEIKIENINIKDNSIKGNIKQIKDDEEITNNVFYDENAVTENKKNVVQTNKTVYFFDKKPEFTGGEEELLKFIEKNLKYPADAYTKKIEGRVFVRFIVNEKGEIENAKIIRSICKSIDEEALRLVYLMPEWIPAEVQSTKVSTWYSIPIDFKISS